MNHPRKYTIVFLLGIIGFFAFFIPVKNFAEQKKPICKNCNVILITLDVLGSNHLPCYGYERNTAPNLCKFAEENVYFTRSYSQNPLTLQSTFSLFTSLYADTHKITTAYENTELDNKYKTLPEVLQNNEYDSIFYGHLNFDPVPLTRGIGRGFSATIKTLNLVENLPIWKDSYKVLLKNTEKNKPTFLYFYSGGSTISYLVREKENFFFEDDYFNNISSIFENAQKFSPDFFHFL